MKIKLKENNTWSGSIANLYFNGLYADIQEEHNSRNAKISSTFLAKVYASLQHKRSSFEMQTGVALKRFVCPFTSFALVVKAILKLVEYLNFILETNDVALKVSYNKKQKLQAVNEIPTSQSRTITYFSHIFSQWFLLLLANSQTLYSIFFTCYSQYASLHLMYLISYLKMVIWMWE